MDGGYTYDWQGYGLEITTPYGMCYLQGDDANNVYDELENLKTDEQIAAYLSNYDDVCEQGIT